MITLWHGDDPHSASVRIALAEKHLDFDGRPVDLAAHEQHGAAFLAVNPTGMVPVLEADGQYLTETFFILQFLNERFPEPPLGGATPQARYTATKWGKYVETHIAPNLAIAGWAMRGGKPDAATQAGFAALTPERRALWQKAGAGFAEAEVSAARAAVDKAIGRVEEELANGPWLAGSDYTIADIAVYPHIAAARELGFALPASVTQWLGRIGSRPAVLDALDGETVGALATMGPERGRWG